MKKAKLVKKDTPSPQPQPAPAKKTPRRNGPAVTPREKLDALFDKTKGGA